MAATNTIAKLSPLEVNPWFNLMNDYAKDASDAAYVQAGKLSGSSTSEIIKTEPEYTPPEVIETGVEISDIAVPKIPAYSGSGAQRPGNIGISSPNHIAAQKPFEEITRMAINIPDLPVINDPTEPIKPAYDLDKQFPDSPDSTLPDEPVLLAINIPSAPTINLPEFSYDLPVANITVPGMTFSFNENLYSSDLLTKVKDELLVRLSGGTGLSPEVENAIWNRGRDREQQASLQAERSILIESSQTGFTRPQGAARAALDRVKQETQAKIIELSREIAISNAEREQENIKTSIQQVISLEDRLMSQHEAINERAFKTAKYMQDIMLAIYNADVAYYNVQLAAYKAAADVFNSLIQAELAKIEVFKSEIEAQALISGINKQYIDIYNAQIEAIKTIVETYSIEVSAVSEELKAESIKISAYAEDVKAYSTSIEANTQKYVGYSEQIKGESVKADINKTEVDAYASRMQAYAAEQGTYDTKARIEIETEDLKLRDFNAKLDSFSRQVEADSSNFSAQTDLYSGQARMYSAEADFKTSQSEFIVKQFQDAINQSQFSYSKSLEAIRVNLANTLSTNELKVSSISNAGSIYAQLSSSALNGISVSASNSSSISNSLGESI